MAQLENKMLKLKMQPSKARVEKTLPSSKVYLSANKKITELIKIPALAQIEAQMFFILIYLEKTSNS